MLRSKPLAIAGCVLLLGAVLIQGGLDIWMVSQPGWDLPSADRPWKLSLRRHSVYLSLGLLRLHQSLSAAIIAGVIVALWGGWKIAPKEPSDA